MSQTDAMELPHPGATRPIGLIRLILVAVITLAAPAYAQPTKLNVAYTSTTTNFSIAWVAKLEGIFRKHNLDVELISMQGPSTYLPALLSGNNNIVYGGGTAVSRAIAAADPNIIVIGSETRYVPLRLMVTPSIKSAADLKGKKLGVGRAGLDEYATLYYLEKNNLVPNKDVALIYTTGGILARAAQMKQGLYDGMAIPPPNEIELEKQGFRELECNDWASSVKFYKEGLCLDVVTHVQTTKTHNIKHPANTWHVVSLEVPEKNRKYLTALQRFAIAIASEEKLKEARETLIVRRNDFAVTEIGDIQNTQDGRSFMLCDLNKNWGEVAAPSVMPAHAGIQANPLSPE